VSDDADEQHAPHREAFLAWDVATTGDWPPPPPGWTEADAAEIRANHGLDAVADIRALQLDGATYGERFRAFSALIVGSPCTPDGVADLEDIGVPHLVFTPAPASDPARRLVLAVWLIRVTRAGTPLTFEQRISLRGEFVRDDRMTVHPKGERASTVADYQKIHAAQALVGLVVPRGGAPTGLRKGRVWTRAEYIEWYRETSELYAGPRTRGLLWDLADAMGVHSEQTVRKRLAEAGLPWPPSSFPDVWEAGS
jgi:hypothetical protein